jgi:hypothetical protein
MIMSIRMRMILIYIMLRHYTTNEQQSQALFTVWFFFLASVSQLFFP